MTSSKKLINVEDVQVIEEFKRNKRILIVDDEKDIANSYKDILCPEIDNVVPLSSRSSRSASREDTSTPSTYTFDLVVTYSAAEALKEVKNDNSQGEYYLPDVLSLFIKEGLKVGAVKSQSFDETRGINTIDQLKEAETILNQRS